jgi:hypothetical protein
MVCINGLPKNSTRDPIYRRLIDEIISLQGKKNVTLVLKYIKSEDNPADLPSRALENKIKFDIFSHEVQHDALGNPTEQQNKIFVQDSNKMTRTEAVNYAFGRMKQVFHEETNDMWKLKLMRTKRCSS